MRLPTYDTRGRSFPCEPNRAVTGYRAGTPDGDTIERMESPAPDSVWLDRATALLFAVVVVLGGATMLAALFLYFMGSSGSEVPLP